MPDAIEDYGDGTHGFVTARGMTPWHRLGTVRSDDALTPEQALTDAKLGGWNVRKVPAMGLEDGETIEVPNKWAVFRTHPVTGAAEANGGIVGNIYEPVQNEELVEFLRAVGDESGAFIQTAGSLDGGADVFFTMTFPNALLIGGVDPMNSYISVFNNHTGVASLRATVSNVRVVCRNTQDANIRGAKSKFAIRHTAGAKDAIEEARKALGLSQKFLDGFKTEADRMLAEEMSNQEFDELIETELCGERPKLGEKDPDTGTKVTPLAIEKYDTEVQALRHLFREADTNDSIRGTRWAAYQSFTEYVDWMSPVYQKDADADLVRAKRSISTDITRQKAYVFDLLKVS